MSNAGAGTFSEKHRLAQDLARAVMREGPEIPLTPTTASMTARSDPRAGQRLRRVQSRRQGFCAVTSSGVVKHEIVAGCRRSHRERTCSLTDRPGAGYRRGGPGDSAATAGD